MTAAQTRSAGPANPPLRVAHVALQLDRGGLEKLLVEFARHTDRGQFDLRFISLTERGTLGREIETSGWPVIAMQEPPGIRPGMVLRLAQLFHQWDIDIVHTHNTKPLLYGGPAARLARAPVVVHTCHGQRPGSSAAHSFMFVQACRSADRIVCVSHDSAALRMREGIPRAKVSTVWNGIDLSRFTCGNSQPRGPAVLVARLSPEKDIPTLLRTTALVIARQPEFRLQIAGDGKCAASLQQLAGELGLDQHVRFLGEVNDIPGLLSRASLLVLPSLTEGISLSVLEAMAQGLPVVATRVGGNPEVILDGQTGLLVPAGDPALLADAMIRVWSDPDLARQMGRAGRRRVEENFDVTRTIAGYEAIYHQLARQRGLSH